MSKHRRFDFEKIRDRAKELRINMTESEKTLWNKKKAVIELDGPVHEKTEEYDEFRDSELQKLGLRVLRIKNEELENMAEVLKRIKDFLDKSY